MNVERGLAEFEAWKKGAIAVDAALGGTVRYKRTNPRTGKVGYERHPFMGKPHHVGIRDEAWCLHWFSAGCWRLQTAEDVRLHEKHMGRSRAFTMELALACLEATD